MSPTFAATTRDRQTRDAYEETLTLVDARCAVAGGFTAGGNWALWMRPQAPLKLIAVAQGSLMLYADRACDGVRLDAGDVAVINGAGELVLADSPEWTSEPVDMAEVFPESANSMVDVGGDEVVVLGGHLTVNAAATDLLLNALPPVSRLRGGSLMWLLDGILREMSAATPGAAFATRRQAHLLLVEIFRAVLSGPADLPPGLLRALTDDRISRVLDAVQREPGRSWTLEQLARLGGMSRTAFTAHFRAAAGVPPMTFLHQWRIRLAERELRRGTTPVSLLAPALGYSTTSAFSTAFKRATGLSPRAYIRATDRDFQAFVPAVRGTTVDT